ncbi:hypothetical protein BH09SUM1_BH09SUM1_03670 [soil metagenome]
MLSPGCALLLFMGSTLAFGAMAVWEMRTQRRENPHANLVTRRVMMLWQWASVFLLIICWYWLIFCERFLLVVLPHLLSEAVLIPLVMLVTWHYLLFVLFLGTCRYTKHLHPTRTIFFLAAACGVLICILYHFGIFINNFIFQVFALPSIAWALVTSITAGLAFPKPAWKSAA